MAMLVPLVRPLAPHHAGRRRALCGIARSVALAALSGAVTVAMAQPPSTSVPAIRLSPAEVVAEPVASTVRIGGPPPAPCVAVDIAGHRAGHLDCATEALREAARIAQDRARAAIETPVPQAGAPDVTVGVSSLSGARLRMGNALGNSVNPQRPTRSFAPPPLGGRQ